MAFLPSGFLGKGHKNNPEQTAPTHENIPRFLMAVCSERIAKTQLDRVKHAISTLGRQHDRVRGTSPLSDSTVLRRAELCPLFIYLM